MYLVLGISWWLMWFFATVILSYIIKSTVVVINLPHSLGPQNAAVIWSILITVFYIPINPAFCLLHIRIGSSNQGVGQVSFKVFLGFSLLNLKLLGLIYIDLKFYVCGKKTVLTSTCMCILIGILIVFLVFEAIF